MSSTHSFSFRLCLMLLLTAVAAMARFVPPAEGPVPFRRDQLPLTAESMVELSRTLGQLGGVVDQREAAGRRGLAQVLALALALDPANREARQHLESAREGSAPTSRPAPPDPRAALDWCWRVVAWLDSPEAGGDGHALAACLRDVLAPLDPKHPGAEVTLKSGEGGAWHGWVPALAAYQGDRRRSPVPDATRPTTTTPAITPGRSDAERPLPETPTALAEAVADTVLWTTDEEGKIVLSQVPVTMRLQPVKESEKGEGEGEGEGEKVERPFFFSLANTEPERAVGDMASRVAGLLEKRHGETYPKGLQALIDCGGADYLTGRNGDSISATVAVLMNAAITGVAPDAIILGVLAEDGSFRLPSRFWEKLRLLGAESSGGRLVVPTEGAEWLAAFLAIEKPGFFMKYEVLLASNLDELITRSSSEPLAASLSFQALKASGERGPGPSPLSGRVALINFLSERTVRQGLSEIVSLAPYHASARLLAVQAAGERPTRLARHLLAVELLRALEPVRALSWPPESGAGSPERAYQSSRAEVDVLERYADTGDRDLLARARELAAAARTLGRRGDASIPEGGSAWRTFAGLRKQVLEEFAAASVHPGVSEP